MNILITGSNGFIGQHVAAYLKDKGEYIVGLGRKDLSSNQYVDEYIKCDLSTNEVKDIYNKTSVQNIDAVIHLAADMRREPYCVEVVESNCAGTQRLLEFCEEKNIGVFLQLSSLPVIGHPIEHPITENHPLQPYTVYHITKHMEEMLADYAYRYFGLRTASFRISAPIGIGVNPKTIFPTFVRNAVDGEDIVLKGNGNRKQNYLYVRDIAQALYRSLYIDKVHGVYNLTSEMLISNKELAQYCIDVISSKSLITFSGKDDPEDSYIWDATIDKLKRDCGYCPEGNIREAILEYAKWYMCER